MSTRSPMTSFSSLMLAPSSTTKRHTDHVRPGVWVDQWGREWAGNSDNKTRHPSGPINPEGWRAPHPDLQPPSMYHHFDDRRQGRMAILVAQWRTDTKHAWEEWAQNKAEYAREKFSTMAVVGMQNDAPELMAMVGPTPMHMDFLDAMLAGNRWVLGLPNRKTGLMDPTPPWATDAWHTLQRFESGAVAEEPADLSKFANPDGDDIDDDPFVPVARMASADIAGRMAGQLDHMDLQEQYQPESQPRESARGPGGKFKPKA